MLRVKRPCANLQKDLLLYMVMVVCMHLLPTSPVGEKSLSLFGSRREVKYMYTANHLEEGHLPNDKDVTEPN